MKYLIIITFFFSISAFAGDSENLQIIADRTSNIAINLQVLRFCFMYFLGLLFWFVFYFELNKVMDK